MSEGVRKKIIFDTKSIARSAVYAAFLSVASLARIQVGPVPMTLQTAAVIVIGFAAAPIEAFAAVFVFLALGLSGVPVLSGGGGLGSVLSPAFGYALAFIPSAVIMSAIKNRSPRYHSRLLRALLGVGIIYVIGVIYQFLIMAFYLHTAHAALISAAVWLAVFIAKDLAFAAALSAVDFSKLRPARQGKTVYTNTNSN